MLWFANNTTFVHEISHEHSAKCPHSTTKHPTFHSARRRGPIHRARIFTLLNMHICFLVHVCPHYQIRIYIPPHTYVRSSFCGFFGICGHDKSDPTAADGLPFCGCLRICKYQKIVLTRTLATRYGTTTYTKHLLSQCKNHTFAM